ncbi:MAG: DUF2228 domain-containing protein [Gemmataceae bacterium]
MSTRLAQRRARIRAEYGFDFPDDFYRFWEFVNRLAPLEPLTALQKDLDLVLVGPFEVLSGRFDGRVPRHNLVLHWRYHDDPPEFFTVLVGGGDGLHFGYFLDDPDSGSGCLSSYYSCDAYELSADGNTLFEAVRLHLEYYQADLETDGDYGFIPPEEREGGTAALARIRQRLCEYATADRPEIGEEYTETYAGTCARNDRVVAETWEGMGIVVPAERYRPLSLTGRRLWRQLHQNKKVDLAGLIDEARTALQAGFPGAMLELGKNLWVSEHADRREIAFQLLDEAYSALGRETLRQVLHAHHVNRSLPSVDILEEELPEAEE